MALLPRLLYLASIPPEAVLESVDARGYDQLARNLRAGHGFSLTSSSAPEPADGLRTPLYPLFVSAIYTLVGPQPVAVAVVQALLDSLTALLVGAIAAWLMGHRAGLIAAALYALTPVQWRYSAALLTEIPLAFLITLTTWLWLKLIHSPRHSTAAICGATAGLVALCKPNVAGLAFLLALATGWALRAKRHAIILLSTAMLFVTPWLTRNWLTFGRPFLSNAALGYVARVTAPATLGVVQGHQVPPWSPEWEARYHDIVTQAARRYGWSLEDSPPSPSAADRRERQIAQVAWETVLAHPWAAVRAHLTGFVRAWAPQEQAFWYSHLTGRPWENQNVAANVYRDAVEILCAGRPFEAFTFAFVRPWTRLDLWGCLLWYAWGVGHLLAVALMFAGGWRLRRRPALVLLLGTLMLYATLPPGPIGYVRFRVPVVPLMTILELAGLSSITRGIVQRWRA